MAEEEKQQETKPEAAATQDADRRKSAFPVQSKLLLLAFLGLAFVFIGSTVLFVVCMLPTFVAFFIDRHVHRTAGITVGVMNFAGTLPFMLQLWETGRGMETALEIMSAPSTMMVAYTAAMAGWFLYFNVPPIVAGMIVGKTERRAQQLEKRKELLIRVWGEGVSQK